MQSIPPVRLRTNAMRKPMPANLHFSFDNSDTYKGHGGPRFDSLNAGLKSAERSLNTLQNEKRNSQSSLLDYWKNVCYNLKCDLAGYHNESLSQRDKDMFGILKIKSAQCENPQRLKQVQENVVSVKNATSRFYNECYEDFKNEPNQQNATRLQVIEETLKHMFMGLQNQDAYLISEHELNSETQKYTDDDLTAFEQNHQYIFLLINGFKQTIQRQDGNPLQSAIRFLHPYMLLPDDNESTKSYKKLGENLSRLSEKWE